MTQFDILPNECECKAIKFGLADLSKLMQRYKWAAAPHFFCVNIHGNTYLFAAMSEEDRTRWIVQIKSLSVTIFKFSSYKMLCDSFLQFNC